MSVSTRDAKDGRLPKSRPLCHGSRTDDRWHTYMSMKRLPGKPDRYKRGGIYLCDLPIQLVTETPGGILHHRGGIQRHGSPPCVVISAAGLNDSHANGLINVPIIRRVNADLAKFKKVPSTSV